jgi:hypothetical protein
MLVADVLSRRAQERRLTTIDVQTDGDAPEFTGGYIPWDIPGVTAADMAPLPG